MQQSYTFASRTSRHTSQSLQKNMPAQPHRQSITAGRRTTTESRAACNTGLTKRAVQCSADTFVVNQSLVLRINICLPAGRFVVKIATFAKPETEIGKAKKKTLQ